MPLVAQPRGVAPSHLGPVLRAIRDMVRDSGIRMTILCGEHYAVAPRSPGMPPLVILVPEPGGRAKMIDALESGHAGRQVHRCDVIVRGFPSGDDWSRWDSVYPISDWMRSAVARAGTGRTIEIGDAYGSYTPPATVDNAWGAQLAWSFAFARDIRATDSIAALPGSAADESEDRPYTPPGETGSLDTITGDVLAKDDDE